MATRVIDGWMKLPSKPHGQAVVKQEPRGVAPDEKGVGRGERSLTAAHSTGVKTGRPVKLNRKRIKKMGLRGGKGLNIPREIDIFPVVPLTIRSVTSAVTTKNSGAVTKQDVLGAIGCIGRVTDTSVTPIASSYRIKRVLVYPAVDATYNEAQMSWFSGQDDREPDIQKVETIPSGVTYPMVKVFYPPKNSLCGQWYKPSSSDATEIVFALAVHNADYVIDVDLDFTINSAMVAPGAITVATAVVGSIYRLALNRTNGAAALWSVVDFPTTI